MTIYNDQTSEWITGLFAQEDEALRRARKTSQAAGLPKISVRPEEGKFLQVLVSAIGARRVVEIGTLGGYSGIWIARGLPQDGKLISLEIQPTHAAVARDNFRYAGLDGRVEVRVGDAHKLLNDLTSEGPFDFVFIDADKVGYPAYFDWAEKNLRIGGVVAAHNAFRQGDVFNRQTTDEGTIALRRLIEDLAGRNNWRSTIYPGGDGMLIAVKLS